MLLNKNEFEQKCWNVVVVSIVVVVVVAAVFITLVVVVAIDDDVFGVFAVVALVAKTLNPNK